MTRTQQLDIFHAQTSNVREVAKAWDAVQRTINSAWCRGDKQTAEMQTKIQALILCAWSEAMFSKLIHTPHGFELHEIEQIKSVAKSNITNAWLKCLELGLSKVPSGPNSSYKPNTNQKVSDMIQTYIGESAAVRNKIAHGQWARALNREHTAVNQESTSQVLGQDTVNLARLKASIEGLCAIIESLIESPDRTFHRDYWVITAQTEQRLNAMSSWTLANKIAQLKLKRSYHSPQA